MKFIIVEPKEAKTFFLIYDEEEYSFSIEPFKVGNDFASIAIGTLQLEINDEGRVMYLWGYYPLRNWKETDGAPEKYENKDLIAVLDKSPVPGVSINLCKKGTELDDNSWSTYINKKRGWICIGSPEVKEKKLIQFSPGCVAALDQSNEMVAVWLQPVEFPKNL